MTASTTDSPHLIYGAMGLGGAWDDPAFGTEQIDIAWAALTAAAEIGIRVIDTADIYRQGSSEQVIGEVLRRDPELRKAFTVQTKCGIRFPLEGNVVRYNLSGDYIRSAIDQAVDRLGGTPIDTMLLHRPDPLIRPDDAAAALREAIDDGKIRTWGVSNMSRWQIEPLADRLGAPAVNQLELSLYARGFVEMAMNVPLTAQDGSNYPVGTVEYCASQGTEIQAWAPLAKGRYSGADLDAADGEASALVAELAAKYETSSETIVLWWLTHHPADIKPVIGTTSPERIRGCRDANLSDSRLTRDEWYRLLTSARGRLCP